MRTRSTENLGKLTAADRAYAQMSIALLRAGLAA